MFKWIETSQMIPESLQLPLEIFLVLAGLVLAVGVGIFALGFVLATLKSLKDLAVNFWRWCFLAPLKVADSFWPILDNYWRDWRKKKANEKVLRDHLCRDRSDKIGLYAHRKPIAFLLEDHYYKQWEGVYLRDRRGGDTFQSWLGNKMESLAITALLTIEDTIRDTPAEENLKDN